MSIRNLKGSIVALVTPFQNDGSVDFGKLMELVECHLYRKSAAILALGSTSTCSTLTHTVDDSVLT